MKISREWLLDFVDFSDLSQEDFSDLITTRVAEIEYCKVVAAPLNYAIVAKIVDVKSVPDKDKLSLVSITTGDESYDVICGAPNVKKDAYVCYVPPGGMIRKSQKTAEEEELIEVEIKSFNGVNSTGVLLSESELGTGPGHENILLLNELIPEISLKAGDKVSSYISGSDLVIDIDNKSLTHRPDLWSHFGFAREISALLDRPLKVPYDLYADCSSDLHADYKKILLPGNMHKDQKVEIDPETGSSRFATLLIENVSLKQSPLWMRRRLFSVGAGIRNILVDTSNYVLHEIGQPNHAYDCAKLRGGPGLKVRFAADGESFIGLDDVPRELTGHDVVIADSEGPVALAGVIGGQGFSVNNETDKILLESATFDPVSIRSTCKKHQLRTDSSNRFEKSLSPYQVPVALIRYVQLLQKSGLEPIVSNNFVDLFENKPESVNIPYDPSYIRSRLGGVPETDNEINTILTRLGFKLSEDNILQVPYYRATRDISIKDDLVEEVGRTIGYDRVPEVSPLITSVGCERHLFGRIELSLRNSLSSQGATEVYNDTFSSSRESESCGYEVKDAVKILNPVDQNAEIVRTTLVPGIIRLVKNNLRHFSEIFCFETGRSYHVLPVVEGDGNKVPDPVERTLERRLLSIAMTCSKKETVSTGTPSLEQGTGFYSMLTVIKRLLFQFGIKDINLTPLAQTSGNTPAQDFISIKQWMHPFRAAGIHSNGLYFGVVSEVRPSVLGVKSKRLILTEIDIQAMLACSNSEKIFEDIPRYPESFFEISVVSDKSAQFSEIYENFKSNLGDVPLVSIEPVSVYEGDPLGSDQKSLSLRFIFRKSDGTISSDELESYREEVLTVLEKSKYSLRS